MADYQQNFLASLADGLKIGQQLKQQRDTSQINRLASMGYGADANQRESLIGQMQQINPQMAQQQERAYEYSDERRNRAMVSMAKLLTNAPEQARPGLYRQMLPTLGRLGLSELPQEYNAQTAPVIDKAAMALVQAVSGQGTADTLQSQKIGADGYIYNTFRDGRMVNTGVKADRQMWLRDFPGMAPELVGKDGSVLPVGGTGQGGLVEQLGGESVYIDPSLPAQVQAELRESLAAGQPIPQQLGGGARARPSEAQTAAATEAAKLGVQLEYLPTELAMRSEAAVNQAIGIERGKTAVEQAAAAPAAIETMQSSIKVIDELLDDPDLGTIVGMGSVNPLNYLPGNKARGLIARAEQISGKAFLAAFNQLKGAGAITEKEGEAATRAMARLDRSQSLEDYRTALADLRAAIAPGLARQRQVLARGQAGQAQPQSAGAPRVQTPDDYARLPSGATYIAPDGSVRRKK